MNLVSHYAPPTYMKPCIVISTVFCDGLKETAVAFVEALNGQSAMSAIYRGDGITKKSEFIKMKGHKSIESAEKYHIKLAKSMRTGVSHKIWEKGYKPYLKIYNKYCPESLKEN